MIAPIAFGVIFLGLWQVLVMILEIEQFIVPSPASIAGEFAANLGSVISGARAPGSTR